MVVERERAVFLAQVVDKPANIQDKIVEGKLDAYFAEICLLEQPYVRDEKGKKKVSELISDAVAKLKENITVARFARFQVGESATVTGDRSERAGGRRRRAVGRAERPGRGRRRGGQRARRRRRLSQPPCTRASSSS